MQRNPDGRGGFVILDPVRLLLPALLAAALLAAPAGARTPVPPAPVGWLGVTADGPMIAPGGAPRGEWDRMAGAGVQTMRASFYWSEIEPQPGVFDFTATDTLVAEATARRMAVLPVIIRAPQWARGGNEYYPPSDKSAIKPVAEALVQRYGPGGSFWAERPALSPMPLRHWQIWNEPSLPLYWWDQPFQEGYVELLKHAAASIRAADPGAKIVLSGLTNDSWNDLEKIYDAGGRGAFDIVALHPYTRYPDDVIRAIEINRRVMRRHGDGALPVWATEITWAAINRKRVHAVPTWATGPQGQADLLRSALRKLARERKRLKLERVIWYTWLSRYRDDEWPDYTGLRRTTRDGTKAMPALKRFRQVAAEVQRRQRARRR